MASDQIVAMDVENPTAVEELTVEEKPNIKGDKMNFVLLSFLYFLQFVVVGLPVAISFVLQKKNVSYNDQAEFSLVSSIYGFKILWAPFVDSFYSKRFGRRKTWLVPMQLLIGALLLTISLNIDNWLSLDDPTKTPHVRLLTVVFGMSIFFASTQDVAVDGWSLTIFQKRNIGYVAPCEKVGTTLGNFCGFVIFILLDSSKFCNLFRSVPQNQGFVSISQFLFFWSLTYVTVTTVVLIFKKENTPLDEHRPHLKESYMTLWNILRLKSVQKLGVFILTFGIAFGPMKNVGPLKLMDAGITGDKIALLAVPSLPFQLTLPFILRRYLVGPRPLQFFIKVYAVRLLNNILYTLCVYFISSVKIQNGGVIPKWFVWSLIVVYNVDTITGFLMFSALIAFCARISDPQYGGVYMTFLMSMYSVGHFWVSSLCLRLVEPLTFQACEFDQMQNKMTCNKQIDGYYVEMVTCTILGLFWMIWGKKRINEFEKLDPSAYVVKHN